jgi:Family of unknown function (DUF6478)
MAGRLSQLIDQWRLQKVQDRWARVAQNAPGMDAAALRQHRSEARTMRRQIDRVIHAADHRLGQPALGSALPRMPLGTDWVWRPDVWQGALTTPGAVAAAGRTAVSDDLALFHDCPLGEVVLRQSRNQAEADRAPFGLAVDVFGFRGSFLSLAIAFPAEAVAGLRARHILRIDPVIEGDQPVHAFARLNVKHGPNVAQLVQDLPASGRDRQVEFDLAYAGLDETRIEHLWLDVIFSDPALSRIVVRDLVASRRPRAEL